MMAKSLAILTVTVALGILDTTAVAWSRGAGGVMPCSLAGINTELHGNIFGKRHPDVAREYGFVKLSNGPGRHGTWGVDPSVCGNRGQS